MYRRTGKNYSGNVTVENGAPQGSYMICLRHTDWDGASYFTGDGAMWKKYRVYFKETRGAIAKAEEQSQ